jgi:hypothetical protein
MWFTNASPTHGRSPGERRRCFISKSSEWSPDLISYLWSPLPHLQFFLQRKERIPSRQSKDPIELIAEMSLAHSRHGVGTHQAPAWVPPTNHICHCSKTEAAHSSPAYQRVQQAQDISTIVNISHHSLHQLQKKRLPVLHSSKHKRKSHTVLDCKQQITTTKVFKLTKHTALQNAKHNKHYRQATAKVTIRCNL